MRSLFYRISDYKEIHPIRFWFIFIGLILMFTAVTYLLKKIIKNKMQSNKKNESESINNEIELNENKFIKFLNKNKTLIGVIIGQFLIIIALIATFSNKNRSFKKLSENPAISSSEYLFGIDISHYQGEVDWSELRTSHHPIEYIFIRSTMGANGRDKYFEKNWENAKTNNYLRGAYHYYRPNENSTQQFENFKSVVSLEKGDFIPILDIEKESRYGRENLRKGVLNWLKLAEIEYGRKPMIYTGLKFYQHILKGFVDDYPLWIAAYSGGKHRLKNVEWSFHQFTDNVRVKGVNTTVDGNYFKSDSLELSKMKISPVIPVNN